MSELPFISIIIPTFDRPRSLRICLDALVRLDYPASRFEVIVVDDGSPHRLGTVVTPFRSRLDVTLLRQANAGPAAARNAGAQHARGTYLAFTDDDCAPAPTWLLALAAQFNETPEALVGGRTLNALPKNPYAEASQLLIHYLYGYYKTQRRQARFFTSNNFALPATRFHELGGFDTSFPHAAGEDREFCARWVDRGGPMQEAPTAVVFHAHTMTLRGFWRQHLNYGRGAYYFHQLHTRYGTTIPTPEPLSFYRDLLHFPIRQLGLRGANYALLLLISQIANTAGYLREALAAPSKTG